MSAPQPNQNVPVAQYGPITDAQLVRLISHVDQLQLGPITDAQIDVISLAIGPLFREVQQWRQRIDLIQSVIEADNVTILPRPNT